MAKMMEVRIDRLFEIEEFIHALDEWGASGPETRHREIVEFLRSPIGLTQYLVRDVEPIVGNA